MSTYTLLIVFVYGTIFGSFLNVCIHRLPREESIAWPASHCPHCQASIAWYHNLPLISYLWLRGRCRHCQNPIAWRYPFIELVNGLGYLGIVWWFGWSWETAVYFLLFSALLAISAIDISHFIIPDVITLPGIAIGIILSATILPVGLWNSLLGVLVGGGLLWIMAVASPLLFGKEGMGGGDIKLLAMIGAFLGWKPTLLTVLVGAFIGSIVGIGLIASKVMQREQYLPFGPFLALGAIVALFFYHDLFNWYAGFLVAAR